MDFMRIANWSTPRVGGVKRGGDRYKLQIKLSICRNCDACNARYEQVKKTLDAKDIDARWENNGEFVTFPLMPPAQTLDYLSAALELPIRQVVWKAV